MSRTVSIRKVTKLSEEEVMSLSYLTSSEITRMYEDIYSFYEEEENSNAFDLVKDLVSRVFTRNGVTMYVARNKFFALGSNGALAERIEDCIDYVRGTYADITDVVSGKEIHYVNSGFIKNWKTGKFEPFSREHKIEFPPKEDGAKIIFFDDMD